MKKLTLFAFLPCMIFFCSCQRDFDLERVELKEKESIVSGHNTELLVSPDIEKTVYLTFDDGPTAATTDILDTLHQFNAKATFFMLEPSMRELPEVVDNIVADGHAVGLHGVTHNKYKFYKSEQSALEEMTTAQETLLGITGIQSNLVRTPYGSVPYLTESYRDILGSNGFKLWDWNVDSSDWSLSNDQYVDTVIKQITELDNAGVTPIILMHDKPNTANHLSILLTYLSEHGFQTKKIVEDTEPYNFNCYDRCHQLSTQE
jgi:peptidoglycan-N-acetylglucosamine deacetylase